MEIQKRKHEGEESDNKRLKLEEVKITHDEEELATKEKLLVASMEAMEAVVPDETMQILSTSDDPTTVSRFLMSSYRLAKTATQKQQTDKVLIDLIVKDATSWVFKSLAVVFLRVHKVNLELIGNDRNVQRALVQLVKYEPLCEPALLLLDCKMKISVNSTFINALVKILSESVAKPDVFCKITAFIHRLILRKKKQAQKRQLAEKVWASINYKPILKFLTPDLPLQNVVALVRMMKGAEQNYKTLLFFRNIHVLLRVLNVNNPRDWIKTILQCLIAVYAANSDTIDPMISRRMFEHSMKMHDVPDKEIQRSVLTMLHYMMDDRMAKNRNIPRRFQLHIIIPLALVAPCVNILIDAYQFAEGKDWKSLVYLARLLGPNNPPDPKFWAEVIRCLETKVDFFRMVCRVVEQNDHECSQRALRSIGKKSPKLAALMLKSGFREWV
jgi:hypothetical protein